MKKRILIVDDTEMNRSLLADILSDTFDIVEAANGVQAMDALRRADGDIALMLLDIIMPDMDGFEVLAAMNKSGLIGSMPVIIISSETSPAYIDHAYDLGATEYISRPFDGRIIRHRVENTIKLYSKQKQLEGMVLDQIVEKEKSNYLMVEILSNIVEFRNGESGLHVMHIRMITETLLKRYVEVTRRPDLTPPLLALIVNASALHDIGKISIPESILNKPGKLTPEEFDIMKTHAAVGANILENSPYAKRELLVQTARDICRWHHERWDGGGYPDGLAGEDIPIAAQVVSLADVYDALTSERVYKPAYSHSRAMDMIRNGECGAFNPVLLQCLEDVGDHLADELKTQSLGGITRIEAASLEAQLLSGSGFHVSNRTLSLLEQERTKYRFFASMSKEIQFEYSYGTDILSFSEWGAAQLGVDELIVHPYDKAGPFDLVEPEDRDRFIEMVRATTMLSPTVDFTCKMLVRGEHRWCRTMAQTLWMGEDGRAECTGVIGKIVDVNDERLAMEELRHRATHDALTGLYNRPAAEELAERAFAERPDGRFAFILFDLDRFKGANDEFGHAFGDEVLSFVARKVQRSIRRDDVAARVGGDEFLVFVPCGEEGDPAFERLVRRLFDTLTDTFEGFDVSVSMGVAFYPDNGRTYRELFHHADEALYRSKRNGRGRISVFDESMRGELSALSPMDSEAE
ncbi:bifunctional diguanylate cyclase/phosphohydrolase [Arabiibacter massiliensis]|uniref:bifunctional diguanylate cyclase/phosphohydrolase n=1 Tax=Arabiibacter massiliensis TaxID=1870985 RepID=UPI0009BC355C|nr:diguanylate cyclase [Arabiibacter massiliensis]